MRHWFLQRGSKRSLEELDLRAERAFPEHGEVEEASYLARPARGFWLWRRPGPPVLVPPFDAEGRDVHDHFGAKVPPFEPGSEEELGALRHARGRIACLEPRAEGDALVLRDLWVPDTPCWRLTDMVDFGLVTPSGAAIAVCCAMSPLVIAPPETVGVEAHLVGLPDRAQRLLGSAETSVPARRGLRVVLHEGDEIELVGVVCDPERSRKRFDLAGRGGPFRAARAEPVRWLLGDEPGLRMVIRRIGAPPPRR